MSQTSLARRIATFSPIALTAIWLVCGIWSTLAPLQTFAPSFILIATVCGWAWAIYEVSIARASPESRPPAWISWVFPTPLVIAIIQEIAGLPTDNSPTSFLFFAALFFGLWHAAKALEYADRGERPITTRRIVGTMLLIFFAIVGAWRLRQRILRVAGPSPLPA